VSAIGVNAETKLHTFSLQQRKLIYYDPEDKYNTILQNIHQGKTKKCMCIRKWDDYAGLLEGNITVSPHQKNKEDIIV
jgi:hypothetical protein